MAESNLTAFRFNDPRQKRIYNRLVLIGESPAAFYRDACYMMTASSLLETTAHLVAHSLREIESALRAVLFPDDFIPPEACNTCKNRPEAYKKQVEAILQKYALGETDLVTQFWLRLADRSEEVGLARFAHRNALAQPRAVDEDFRKTWDEMEAFLDRILEIFETNFLESFRLLDELLNKSSPSKADVKKLKNKVPHNLATFGYFFGKLTSPAWLEPLWTGGFFKYPPEPDRNEERGTIGFPSWPQSRWLARMAGSKPEEVIKIIVDILSTDNISIHEDLAEAALAMPAEIGARWVEKETRWIAQQERIYGVLPDRLGALIGYLAKGGQREVALDLAKALFTVLPDSRVTARTNGKRTSYLLPQPQARFDTWTYKEILEKNLPDLVAAAGEKALTLLCELLDSAIRLSRLHKDEKESEYESYIWRETIEDHEQNYPYDLKALLVSAVRDAAEQIIQPNPLQVPAVIEQLDRYPWFVFQRIALYLLRRVPDAAPVLVAERLLDVRLLGTLWCRTEYQRLLRSRFDHLSSEEQNKWLNLIEAGPARDIEQDALAWQKELIAPVVDKLPKDWRLRHPEWVEGVVVPDNFRPIVIEDYDGPTSPKNVEDLRSMSIQEIVTFLKTWQPLRDFMDPSPEGLRRELTALVASDPEHFAVEASRFQGLDPTYLRGVLFGLREAIKEKRAFPWPSVLKLCRWVIEQPREIPGRKSEYDDLDPDWGWTRKAIADLLVDGFVKRSTQIPFDLRIVVWEILKPLTADPDPTQKDEGSSRMDPAMRSINTTRGEAMHAVMWYALWVRQHIEEAPDKKKRIERGFREMPEVQEVLDAHLDPESDASLAIRAVYGQRFPWLVLLDREWATSAIAGIFPPDESLRDLHNAAWESYIIFCTTLDDNVFKMLREEYRRAVELIGTSSTQWRQMANPDERLAEHLMLLYGWGKLVLDEPDGLLARFYEKASDALRGYAMNVAGRRLYADKAREDIPAEFLDRLKALWEQRLAVAKTAPSLAPHVAELTAFGWWFASARFADTWAITQLTEILKLVGKVDAERWVVERLAVLVTDMPQQAVECLRRIVEGNNERWSMLGWQEYMRTILATAIQSTDVKARKAAKDLINLLATREDLGFIDLL